jgi:ASC-1-like (ASCH) protein
MFSLLARQTELYLGAEYKCPIKVQIKSIESRFLADELSAINRKKKNGETIESKVRGWSMKVKIEKSSSAKKLLKKEKLKKFASKSAGYATQTIALLREIKSGFMNLYSSVVSYTRSIYKSEGVIKKKGGVQGYQIGIEFSRYCHFIFFPRKPKKITGYLIDLGILVDYVNPAPTFCYS